MHGIEIRRLCQELRLFGIQDSFETRSAAAQAEGQPPEDFLTRLLEDERMHRRNAKARLLDHQAQFRRNSYLEKWDNTFERGLSKAKLRELSTLSFWQDKANLILTGGTGSGKTELSIILGKQACQAQLSVKFTSVSSFFEEAESLRAAGKIRTWFSKQKKYDIVVFDDFGLRTYSHEEAILLLDFLEERYQKKVHIFSSQVEVEGWRSLFEDPVVADALIDRIKNPSQKIKITGSSYRERLGLKSLTPPQSLTQN